MKLDVCDHYLSFFLLFFCFLLLYFGVLLAVCMLFAQSNTHAHTHTEKKFMCFVVFLFIFFFLDCCGFQIAVSYEIRMKSRKMQECYKNYITEHISDDNYWVTKLHPEYTVTGF